MIVPSPFVYQAFVKRVVDGDTLDLTVDLGFSIRHDMRVRLTGVDTPEVYGVKKGSEEYQKGLQASDMVKKLLVLHRLDVDGTPEPSTLVVQTNKDRTGKYGRYLAVIFYTHPDTGQVQCLNDILIDIYG